MNAVRRSQPIELDKNVLKRWSGISSLADPGGSERRELGDGRLARGTKISTPQIRWLSVALATSRFETLNSCELQFGSRRECNNNDWTEDTNDTSGVRRAWVTSRVRILIGLLRRSRVQRTTTTGLISCDVGEHCLVSLRAANKRQRSEDIPLRWNPCRRHP